MTIAELTLKEQYQKLLTEQPNLRIRNAAHVLGVSEAELLCTKLGEGVIRLRPEIREILGRIESLGYVMALTRNEDVVHERKGIYKNAEFGAHASLFVGPDIDLRMFLSVWKSAFAEVVESPRGIRRSLQFFAGNGEAVHKIYLTPKSDVAAFDALVEAFRMDPQTNDLEIIPRSAPDAELPDSEIDVDGFRQSWVNLQDTHDFFGLLRSYGVTRTQALRLAPSGNYAVPVSNDALRKTLNAASRSEVPIMVFVGNPGMIQIHTGPVKKIVDHDQWLNVMDPEFNLHVNEPKITQSWVVRKPTVDGVVTSLELFNANDELISTLFGKRKPGIPEDSNWTALIATVESECKR